MYTSSVLLRCFTKEYWSVVTSTLLIEAVTYKLVNFYKNSYKYLLTSETAYLKCAVLCYKHTNSSAVRTCEFGTVLSPPNTLF